MLQKHAISRSVEWSSSAGCGFNEVRSPDVVRRFQAYSGSSLRLEILISRKCCAALPCLLPSIASKSSFFHSSATSFLVALHLDLTIWRSYGLTVQKKERGRGTACTLPLLDTVYSWDHEIPLGHFTIQSGPELSDRAEVMIEEDTRVFGTHLPYPGHKNSMRGCNSNPSLYWEVVIRLQIRESLLLFLIRRESVSRN